MKKKEEEKEIFFKKERVRAFFVGQCTSAYFSSSFSFTPPVEQGPHLYTDAAVVSVVLVFFNRVSPRPTHLLYPDLGLAGYPGGFQVEVHQLLYTVRKLR